MGALVISLTKKALAVLAKLARGAPVEPVPLDPPTVVEVHDGTRDTR